ncbi:hypothetical protein JNE43_11675 [Kocuria rhizophila]|uniref:DUF5677 domain-containing protein n=1 Tax=Kocuria rhizophila TaxID=72000 RepID=UPI001DD05F02|nr:DUF5677 domain-containing protein [Kocuria rhizophila]MCC5675453.1 hypothetical protein [Kocuria rhizophila]
MSFPRPNAGPGPLADHVRKGRVYQSPLASTGVLQIEDWARDDLPDFLWPILLLELEGNEAARRFIAWQRDVQQDVVDLAEARFVAECLDGRLTSLERLTDRVPTAKQIIRSRALEHGLLPDRVTRALGSYFHRPAEWLISEEVQPPGRRDIDLLASAVLSVLKDGHREALIKCMFIWSAVQAGTLSTSQQTIDLLAPYPTELSTRDAADSAIRAMWGSHRSLLTHDDPNYFRTAIQWARMFWGTNSITTGCLRKRETEEPNVNQHDAPATEEANSDYYPPPTAFPDGTKRYRGFVLDVLSSYAEALETAPSELHQPERQEVNAGLVFRAGRELAVALGYPDLWCEEHGSHITRTLAETRIILQWMTTQDLSIYERYKDYGAGKAKLYTRILDEIPEDARSSAFLDGVRELRKLSHNDESIDYRVVDTRDSFSGKSLRSMAEEAELLDLYRHVYQMASGTTHGEWWSIENNAMERCLNVLHRGHLIPSLHLNVGGNAEFAWAWVQQFYSIVRLSMNVLGTDPEVVESVFAWVSDESDGESVEPEAAPHGE